MNANGENHILNSGISVFYCNRESKEIDRIANNCNLVCGWGRAESMRNIKKRLINNELVIGCGKFMENQIEKNLFNMYLVKENINMDKEILLSELDSVFFDENKYLQKSKKEEEYRKYLIRKSYLFHLENNPFYAQYVSNVADRPDVGEEEFDIYKIPLLPSQIFKRKNINICSVDENSIVKYCCSSGTQGSQSIIPRDEDTLSRFVSSISASLNEQFGVERTGNYRGIVLGPTTDEAGDLWFSNVISCISLNMQTEYFEREGNFSAEKAVKAICNNLLDGKNLFIIGPPFRILEVAKIFNAMEMKVPFKNSFIVSAGGWKKQENKSINVKEYRKFIKEAFEIESDTCIRDSFNMVELNTVISECSCHKKHVKHRIWLNESKRLIGSFQC